jgi:hypothetical protein
MCRSCQISYSQSIPLLLFELWFPGKDNSKIGNKSFLRAEMWLCPTTFVYYLLVKIICLNQLIILNYSTRQWCAYNSPIQNTRYSYSSVHGATCHLHCQGQRISHTRNKHATWQKIMNWTVASTHWNSFSLNFLTNALFFIFNLPDILFHVWWLNAFLFGCQQNKFINN